MKKSFIGFAIIVFFNGPYAYGDPIKVAFISATSGVDPNTSFELKRGIDIFMFEHPDSKKRFSIDSFDNKGNVQETVLLAEHLSKQGYKAIVGIARSDEALGAAQIAKENDLLFMTPFATSSKLSNIDKKVIQVCYSDEQQGHALAAIVKSDLKSKRILALVNTESLYSIGLFEKFNSEVILNKSVSLRRINYSEKDLNRVEIEKQARQFKPDLIFIPDHITRAATFAKQLVKLFPSVTFLGGDGFGGKKILTGVFGDTPKIDLYYTTHWHSDIKGRINVLFVRRYKELYGREEPTSGAAMMFDLMNILDSALKSGARKPSDLAAYIRTNKFETTTGETEFPDAYIGVRKPIVVLHLKDSRYGFFKTVR